jgi:hypothetical protein
VFGREAFARATLACIAVCTLDVSSTPSGETEEASVTDPSEISLEGSVKGKSGLILLDLMSAQGTLCDLTLLQAQFHLAFGARRRKHTLPTTD